MDIIELARELGAKLQQESSYTELQKATDAVEKDDYLQEMIGEFNLKKLALNEKLSDDNRDEDEVKALNDDMRRLYAEIMDNAAMARLNEVKSEFDTVIQRVFAIISNSANGEDPMTTDVHSCGGSCESCGGCH